MRPNNKNERNELKKKLMKYYEFGKPMSYINGMLHAACKRCWNKKIRREEAYDDTHVKIGNVTLVARILEVFNFATRK